MADADYSVKAIITAQTTQFKKEIKNAQSSIDSMSKSIEGVQKLIKGAFSVVGITAGIGAVVNFGKKSVQAADDANKKFSVLKNTIEATGASTWTSVQELDKMAKDYAKTTNYSVSEVEKMQSVLLGFRNITDETFREASDAIMDMATVMGMDLTSAVQTVGKALDDPIKGLDSLRRQGFAFTDEQKLELEVLVKTGKQLEAQKIILEELSTTYGGAAKAGQSAFAQMQHSMDALMESVGNRIIPIIRAVTGEMSGGVEKITEFFNSSTFDRIIDILANIAEKVRTVFDGIVKYISGIFTQLEELSAKVNFSPFIRVLDTLYGLVVAIFEKIKERIDESIKDFRLIFSGISSAMGESEINTIVNAINTVIDAVWFLFDQIEIVAKQIKDAIYDVISYFINELGDADSAVSKWTDYIYNQFNSAFRTIQDLIYSVSAMLKGDWSVAWEYAKLAVMRSIVSMLDGITNLSRGFYGLVDSITFGVTDLKSQVADLTSSFGVDEAIANIEQKIKEMTGKTADIALSDLKGISTASNGMFTDFIAGLTKTTDAVKTETNKQQKQFSSSFTETRRAASETSQGIQKGLLTLKENWEKDAKDWSDVTTSVAGTIGGAFEETFGTLGEELVEGGGSFEDYSAVAVDAISQVLRALAAQLAALAAARAANYDYGTAALAAAGAAAALVASGVMSGIAKSMKKVREETQSTSEAISNFSKTLEELKEANTNLAGFSDIVARSNDLIRTSMLNLADIVNKNEKALSLFNMTTSDFWRLVENTSTSAEELAIAINPFYNIEFSKYNDTVKAIEQYRNALSLLDDSLNDVRKSLNETNKSLEANAWAYRYIISNYTDVMAKETKSKLLQGFMEVLETVATIGADIGETMMDSIADGASKSDFMLQMKKMLRENMIKLTVYNSEFTENISRISGDLSKAILQNSESQIQSAVTEIEKLYDTASEVAKRVDDVLSGMFAGYEEESDEVVDIFSELQKAIQSFRDSFVDIGSEVADKLIAGISDGLKEQELFEVIKNYIRDNIIKASVYANYASELAEIGKSITAGIVDKSGAELENAKNKISKIYREMTESMQAIDEMLCDVFGKSTVEAVEETAEEVVDNLSKLENAINSFKESIADVGADIASNLINGLTNGLSQSDFLTNMKDWLRKMLLQAVVYTETMKNEIEAIGKAISAGISGGFTDISLHEIRRDLSYIFEQANKSVGKIDEVLGGVFGYANGTQNATRGLHIVGEAGPELVRFRGGEQVYNNRDTMGMLSESRTNNFNVTFNNLRDTSAFAMMNQLKQYNRELAVNGVI